MPTLSAGRWNGETTAQKPLCERWKSRKCLAPAQMSPGSALIKSAVISTRKSVFGLWCCWYIMATDYLKLRFNSSFWVFYDFILAVHLHWRTLQMLPSWGVRRVTCGTCPLVAGLWLQLCLGSCGSSWTPQCLTRRVRRVQTAAQALGGSWLSYQCLS